VLRDAGLFRLGVVELAPFIKIVPRAETASLMRFSPR
jgi:hypothetical protein